MIFEQIKVAPMDNFNYVIGDTATRRAAFIDPGFEEEKLYPVLEENGLKLDMVLLTHGHFDHVNGLPRVVRRYPELTVYVHANERAVIDDIAPHAKIHTIDDGAVLTLGQLSIKVYATPGHSPGGLSYRIGKKLFTGDALFINACGRADLPGSSPIQLFESLQKLKRLPDDYEVYCGHDYGPRPYDTLGNQKESNPYLLAETQETFHRLRMGGNAAPRTRLTANPDKDGRSTESSQVESRPTLPNIKHYDYLIIGSGGGAKLSRPARERGKRVALIECDALGGTCLNRGCIPSKMMIHPAHLIREMEHAPQLQVQPSSVSVDFEALVKRISDTIDAESEGIVRAQKKLTQQDMYRGSARFISDNVVAVGDVYLSADHILIATGSRPYIPQVEGLADTPFWTSREALRNTKLPRKLIISGGGYIACELAHAYSAFGTKVEILVRSELLRHEDHEIRTTFAEAFGKRHQVQCHAVLKKVDYRDGLFHVTYTDAEDQLHSTQGDALLIANGTVPNTDDLGLDTTQIQTDSQGYIRVDDNLRTTVPTIYAIGDVTGRYQFRHSVNFEAEYLAEHLLGGDTSSISYPPMPHAVFTYPEIASVGKREDDLTEGSYLAVVHHYRNSGQGMARLPDYGFVKLIFDTTSQTLIGAHILGSEAATMLHQLIYAMKYRATVNDLLSIIYIHPALPEIVRNAARKARALFAAKAQK